MIPGKAILLQFVFGLGSIAVLPFNNPPGVDIWCGKAYRETNSSFDPGGQLTAPEPSKSLLLDLRFYPRMNLYLSTEEKGSFIVDTPVSYIYGSPYENRTFEPNSPNASQPLPFRTLNIQIWNSLNNKILVPWGKVEVNSTGKEFSFDLSLIDWTNTGSTRVRIIGTSPDGLQSYQSVSTVRILPPRNDTGSVSRIDQRYGALQVKSSLTNDLWKPIFPYSFYTSYDWIVSTLNNASATKNLSTYRALGYNIIHPVPPWPLNVTVLKNFLTICDELELYVMYDMRGTYQNTTAVTEIVALLQKHPSLLLYYTADEPDGAGDTLNATNIAFHHINNLDPYHPISLVLNCANFYFGEYASGAHIILEDTYPIAANTSFSPVYHTVCNSTWGDCGCDDCHAGDPAYPEYVKNKFLDISTRMDDFYRYQEWLGWASQGTRGAGGAPVWGVPQAFYDQGSFWSRFPTPEEEVVMGILRLNHGAKGIVAWIYPTSEPIEKVTGQLATLASGTEFTSYTLEADGVPLEVIGGNGLVDATAWVKHGKVLVSVVYLGYEDHVWHVNVVLPTRVEKIEKTLWGKGDWKVGNGTIYTSTLKGLEVSILLLS
ncbi:uncharacterized protein BDR25DRAFT_295415 [Lindgomyces ingoldianus]|uniref:Uncharacterized protein n=1 Tax=Lindgomyces ingoldianus TaxID=673940 RepID=A0ACB6QEL8_9PLEO|nr:uncharacterized protein BDR25DRAFT_295415 [Lindgomyces ingoldianus]KAF2465300.1 hypothetical protein BDR25DRAFT_295415 [Lindgomyces ingoldianus]